jgi:lipoprotein-anchoring transpeptidase ErfK/SrfK
MFDYSKFNVNMLEFMNDNSVYSDTNFAITTSLMNKYTYIFLKNNNKWTLLYKWPCSIGSPKTPTITGVFKVKLKLPFFGLKKGYRAKWATQIIGEYLYHSILFNVAGDTVIDGRLGMAISNGCIRLATNNAKWIYDNIPKNSVIIIK